jgi:hypothetical protein
VLRESTIHPAKLAEPALTLALALSAAHLNYLLPRGRLCSPGRGGSRKKLQKTTANNGHVFRGVHEGLGTRGDFWKYFQRERPQKKEINENGRARAGADPGASGGRIREAAQARRRFARAGWLARETNIKLTRLDAELIALHRQKVDE